jgi:hypothetical protein
MRFAAHNAIALVALFVALGGVSYAATNAFTASSGQLTACVGESHVFKLKANRKPCPKGQKTVAWNQTGPAGVNGAKGTIGASGPSGATGSPGAAGASALSPLPSGASESGEFLVQTNGYFPEFIEEPVTFSVPLAAPIDDEHIVSTTSGSGPNCPGPGSASPGFLCFYSVEPKGVTLPLFFNYDSGAFAKGTGRFGFDVEWEVIGAAPSVRGTYTVTAP